MRPTDEAERLAELQDCGLLDTPEDDEFDRLVALAAQVCNTPIAALTLVDGQRIRFLAQQGLGLRETPRTSNWCAQTILDSDRLLHVADVARSSWRDHPWAAADGSAVRFYAGAPIKLRQGSAIGALCVLDVVPRRLNAAQRAGLERLAATAATQIGLRRQLRVATQTDRLTGLPNWHHFESRFAQERPSRGVVAFVRLKTVSHINSAHGFRVADALIQQAAERLRLFAQGTRSFVSRVKRGLFVLCVPQEGASEFARQTAPALQATLSAPYEVADLTLACPINIGYAAFPQHGRQLDDVVNAADAALQTAIERDLPLVFFNRAVDSVHSLHFRLEPQLRLALQRGEFVNHYQPKVDLRTGELRGVEALVRWMHPQRGLVAPAEFVPALESTGLIREVGRQVVHQAVADWAGWRAAGRVAPRIAVNVAAAQLRHGDFVAELAAALRELGRHAAALSVEVTESVLIADMQQAVAVLKQVRALGVPVAIDDFGTGYSSLAYIATLPIDEVKIDRSFIENITAHAAYRDIVETCITLAHNLGLSVVAEGVETQSQSFLLAALGCDQSQGFLHGAPVPAAQLALRLPFRRDRKAARA